MLLTTESGGREPGKGSGSFTMCTSCHKEEGAVAYGGETVCSRCASLREWAVVIAMIQRQLEPSRTSSAVPGPASVQVGADPFSAA